MQLFIRDTIPILLMPCRLTHYKFNALTNTLSTGVSEKKCGERYRLMVLVTRGVVGSQMRRFCGFGDHSAFHHLIAFLKRIFRRLKGRKPR